MHYNICACLSLIQAADLSKFLNEEIDYDKFPVDNISAVEVISVKSSDVLGSRVSILDYKNTDYIVDWLSQPRKLSTEIVPDEVISDDIFSFIDSETGDMEMFSGCTTYDHYTSDKLENNFSTYDSTAASDSAAMTGSTTIDSGIDSHSKFPE